MLPIIDSEDGIHDTLASTATFQSLCTERNFVEEFVGSNFLAERSIFDIEICRSLFRAIHCFALVITANVIRNHIAIAIHVACYSEDIGFKSSLKLFREFRKCLVADIKHLSLKDRSANLVLHDISVFVGHLALIRDFRILCLL